MEQNTAAERGKYAAPGGNSLAGSAVADEVGVNGVTALSCGTHVVGSSFWDATESAIFQFGAVTWRRHRPAQWQLRRTQSRRGRHYA
jgi:hypothetical protein